MSWRIPATLWRGVAGLDLAGLGIPTEADYVASYRAATRREGLEHWEFYLAYNLFRIAAILQGIARRALDGNAAATNATNFGRKARPLAALGWDCAQRYAAARRG